MAESINLQYQVRQNSEELQDFLKDLHKWEDEVQAKDELLSHSGGDVVSSHPVRNKPVKKKSKPKPKVKLEQSKIKSYDYRAWDKFNVNEALKEIDNEDEMRTQSTSEDESDSDDEEYAEQRRLQQALFEKQKGNDLFKEGKYEAAINRYTTAITLDPYNAILPANRALALIKVKRYGAAIQDCDTAVSLDKTYIKAYARRASAKKELGQLEEALQDYEIIIKLQPGNKQAVEDVEKIKKMMAKKAKETTKINEKRGKIGDSEPLKKPMKRYIIEEIGSSSSDEDENHICKKTDDLKADLKHDKSMSESKEHRENGKLITDIDERESEVPDDGTEQKMANMACVDSKDSTCQADNEIVKTIAENTREIKRNDKNEILSERTDKQDHFTESPNIEFTIPVSSVQFQTTWKRLEKYPELRYKYMKIIPPDRLPKVVGESVESTLLLKIFSILRECYVRDGLCVFNEMKCISEMKRFSMTLMFLSDKEKLVIHDLFDYLSKLQRNKQTFSEQDLQSLKQRYGLR